MASMPLTFSSTSRRSFWRRHSTSCRYLPFFFFNDTATTEIYTLSLHDALPISTGLPKGRSRLRFLRAAQPVAIIALLIGATAAQAVDAVNVRPDAAAIDLTAVVERHKTEVDRIQVAAAPGPDGIVRRIQVPAREGNTNWAVFALANSSDEQMDRLIVVPHYRMVGSGLLWPDLGLSRVVYILSSGEPPERQDSATADIFRITLDPGAVLTFVAELRTDKLPQIYLWQPDAYKDKVNSLTLYHG